MAERSGFVGRWRLASMDLWDTEAVDLVEPGFIEFDRDGGGQFGFVAVQGLMDCRESIHEGSARIEFTWDGSDEGDQVSGRGWAVLADDGTIDGRIYFHLGDDSGFHGTRLKPRPATRRSTSR
jgi:hypothetical protein